MGPKVRFPDSNSDTSRTVLTDPTNRQRFNIRVLRPQDFTNERVNSVLEAIYFSYRLCTDRYIYAVFILSPYSNE